jgi:hypothetical protein
MTEHHDTFKTILDGLSILTVIGTLNEMLPSIASLFTIVWLGFRIWETDTVRGWTGRGTTNAIDK